MGVWGGDTEDRIQQTRQVSPKNASHGPALTCKVLVAQSTCNKVVDLHTLKSPAARGPDLKMSFLGASSTGLYFSMLGLC